MSLQGRLRDCRERFIFQGGSDFANRLADQLKLLSFWLSDNARLRERLKQATDLVDRLDAHEGAEGWSEDLRKDIDAFRARDTHE